MTTQTILQQQPLTLTISNDIYTLPAKDALHLLATTLECIVTNAVDVPPSPPSHILQTDIQMTTLEAEKSNTQHQIDGVRLKQPYYTHHSALTRKFYSKLAPPLSITDYLNRLHRFCPMSTAVYLAAALYIHRLHMPITVRNVHRLVLAALGVAMKALEDETYRFARIARAGGVSEQELVRLEVSFLFLVGFEVGVQADELRRFLGAMRRAGHGRDIGGDV